MQFSIRYISLEVIQNLEGIFVGEKTKSGLLYKKGREEGME